MRKKHINTRIEEREYSLWLSRIERRGIIPLKWAVFFFTLIIYLWTTNWHLLHTNIFIIFFFYVMFTIAESYFFYFGRITVGQIKAFCYSSFVTDLIFITLLISFNISVNRDIENDFYILYFLMILRGFALFRTSAEVFVANLVITILFFISTIFTEQTVYNFIKSGFAIKITLFWMVMLFSWFMIGIINKQRSQLLKIRDRLIRSENLASIGNLAASIAHEINNPIGIIIANVEYLLRDAKNRKVYSEEYTTIINESKRCDSIIKQLLRFTSNNSHHITSNDLREMNDEILAQVFHRKQDLACISHKEYADKVPLVEVDEAQVKYALLNIYQILKQSLGEKCQLSIDISVSLDAMDDVLLNICDSNIKIDEEELTNIFEPFRSMDNFENGLGLYIAQRILESNNAQISVKSNKDSGMCLSILFRK